MSVAFVVIAIYFLLGAFWMWCWSSGLFLLVFLASFITVFAIAFSLYVISQSN